MYDIEIENKASIDIYDDVLIPSRHAPNKQRPTFSEFYGLSQWNLAFGHIFCCLLVTLHQKEKNVSWILQVMMTSSIRKQ